MLANPSQLVSYVNSLTLFKTLATNQECCDRGEHRTNRETLMQDLKQQNPMAVLLNIVYRIVSTDLVHDAPRKTARVLHEFCID